MDTTQNQPITKSIFSPAHKAAISAGLKGRKQSEEQKAARKATWKRKMELRQKTHAEMF